MCSPAEYYDYQPLNLTLSVLAGVGFGVELPFLFIETYGDGLREDIEGLVLFLEIQESGLDPRDVGNVSLSRSAYLLRINQTGKLFRLSESKFVCYT